MFSYFYNKYKSLIEKVNKHPYENNMTYSKHFNHAINMSFKLAYAGVAVFIHAIYPPVHEKTASIIIKDLYFQNLNNIKKN
jgi:hypothetical protein